MTIGSFGEILQMDDVKKFLNYFTEIGVNELSEKIENEKDINNLKILLANEATTIMHGAKAAKDCADTAKETFVKGVWVKIFL